jgi:hypothetical protein
MHSPHQQHNAGTQPDHPSPARSSSRLRIALVGRSLIGPTAAMLLTLGPVIGTRLGLGAPAAVTPDAATDATRQTPTRPPTLTDVR